MAIDGDLMNNAIRMVIPMRREFARLLDVTHFLHDSSYAREIITQAKASKDTRLRGYAAYMELVMFGPSQSAQTSTASNEAQRAAQRAAGTLPTNAGHSLAQAKRVAVRQLKEILGPNSDQL